MKTTGSAVALKRTRGAGAMARASLRPDADDSFTGERVQPFCDSAVRIRSLSVERDGRNRALEMVGVSPVFVDLLGRLEKIARYHEPVLITGESGVGKEQFGRALYLLSGRSGSYVTVNCPQYQEGDLTVSELFGHVRGSFTGAIADRRGAFEQADGGILFLDEIGDLHPGAQAMLLRTLSTGEFRPLGADRTRTASTRVVSATNRSLNQLVMSGDFRYDLFFRLRHFHLSIPPLRDRGDDWRLIADYWLYRLRLQYGPTKRLSPETTAMLATYDWPGNVRQLIGVLTSGYAMADDDLIRPGDIESLMARPTAPTESGPALFERVAECGEDFWKVVYQPFLNRQLNRAQVRSVISAGLGASRGSYRRLLDVLHMPASDYQRFMDFLRHHDLKP